MTLKPPHKNYLLSTLFNFGPQRFFVWTASLLFILYSVYRPPFFAPDEFNHFLRAYQLSEGKLRPEKQNNRVGAELPKSLGVAHGMVKPYSYLELFTYDHTVTKKLFDIPLEPEQRIFYDFPNTALYSIFPAFVYAIPIAVLKTAGASIGVIYYGSKLAVFLFLVWIMQLAIKRMPFHKWTLAVLLSLPMNAYLMNAVSGDPITTALVVLLIALFLEAIFIESVISTKKVFTIALILLTILLGKTVYVCVIALLPLIPIERFGSRRRKYLTILALCSFAAIITMVLQSQIEKNFVPFKDYNPDYATINFIASDTDLLKQKEYIATHKVELAESILTTIKDKHPFYVQSFISGIGITIDVLINYKPALLALLILCLIAFTEKTTVRLLLWQRLYFVFVAFVAVAAIFYSQYLIWTPVGSDHVDGVQGRYFYPIAPLFLTVFANRLNRFDKLSLVLAIPYLSYLHWDACVKLENRYSNSNYNYLYRFSVDFETVNPGDTVITADPSIQLGQAKISRHFAQSGNQSLCIPPGENKSFYFYVDNYLQKDVLTITAWQKGKELQYQFSGEGDGCGHFSIEHSRPFYAGLNDWDFQIMHIESFVFCRNNKMEFALKNTGNDTVYIDDFTFAIKRRLVSKNN